ncbi:MAG: TolB family protein, partial [Vicinamibacterales bacterium]
PFFCAILAVLALGAPVSAQRATTPGRALAIEDYYRIQTVANPQISPDGNWVVFTIATRIEQDNSSRTEVHVVPSNGSAAARRIVHYGQDVSAPSWGEDGRLRYTVERQQWAVDPGPAANVPEKVAELPNGSTLSADKKW